MNFTSYAIGLQSQVFFKGFAWIEKNCPEKFRIPSIWSMREAKISDFKIKIVLWIFLKQVFSAFSHENSSTLLSKRKSKRWQFLDISKVFLSFNVENQNPHYLKLWFCLINASVSDLHLTQKCQFKRMSINEAFEAQKAPLLRPRLYKKVYLQYGNTLIFLHLSGFS